MSSTLNQIPTDIKKYIDETFFAYLPKVKTMRSLMREVDVDIGQINLVYGQMQQNYTESQGYTGFGFTPPAIAEGTFPPLSSFGTTDTTSQQVKYGLGFEVDQELLQSSVPFIQDYVARNSVELLNSIETMINSTLYTNMFSNAGTSYTATGGAWSGSGNPVSDVIDAMNSFKKRSGGLDADFLALNPDNYADLAKDNRFQSTWYTNDKPLETGKITPRPFGLEVVTDTVVTSGTFLMGKKGMFGTMYIGENYTVYPFDKGIAGKRYDAAFKFIDQYQLPYYLLKGTGING